MWSASEQVLDSMGSNWVVIRLDYGHGTKGPLKVERGSDLFSSQVGLKYFLIFSGVFTSSMMVRISSNFLSAFLVMFAQSSYLSYAK